MTPGLTTNRGYNGDDGDARRTDEKMEETRVDTSLRSTAGASLDDHPRDASKFVPGLGEAHVIRATEEYMAVPKAVGAICTIPAFSKVFWAWFPGKRQNLDGMEVPFKYSIRARQQPDPTLINSTRFEPLRVLAGPKDPVNE